MPADLDLDPRADDQELLAQVVNYYHATLKETPDALAHLQRRGLTSRLAIDYFRIGYADRSLGLRLPSRQIVSGKAIRERLHQLGVYRDSGHEHFRGSLTVPIFAADGSGQIADLYGRKTQGEKLRRGTPVHTHLNDEHRGVWNIEALGASEEIVLCGWV